MVIFLHDWGAGQEEDTESGQMSQHCFLKDNRR
jgi:hypothetical protein